MPQCILRISYLVLLYLVFAFQIRVDAQPVIITGRITVNGGMEGLPFASIYAKGTNIKTASDFDGYYKLKLKQVPTSLSVTCIGFKTQTLTADKVQRTQNINFDLNAIDSTTKQLVELNKSQWSAIVLVQHAIDYMPSHNKARLEGYGFEAYTKIQTSFTDISDRFQNRKFFRPLKFAFNHIDSTTDNKPFLPFFISETVGDYYFEKKKLKSHELIKASKTSGLDNINISQFLGTTFAETEIYGDYIIIFKRQFLSPLSRVGINSYNYYLIDSTVLDKTKCYHIRFSPKSKKLLRLEGEFWLTDSTYAVKQINFKIRSKSNINLISGFNLHAEYVPVYDSVWMLKKENLTINFSSFKNWPSSRLQKNAFYKTYLINADRKTVDSLFKKDAPDISVKDSANLRTETYWKKARNNPAASGNESEVYHVIDTISRSRITKNYLMLMQTMFLGFANIGPVSIGNIFSFASKNNVQGWHFKLSLRTNQHLNKYVQFGGYLGYGVMDRKVRYGAQALGIIKREPRISVQASYRFDVVSDADANTFFLTPDFLAVAGIRRVENGGVIPIKLMEDREMRYGFFQEFKYGYSYSLGFKNQILTPKNFNFSYHTQSNEADPNTDITSATVSEFNLHQRFAWKERFIGSSFTRYSLGSKFPIVSMDYGFGVKHILGSQFSYHRLVFGVNDTRVLGPAGKLRINVEVGKVFGTLPYILLPTPNAAETYISHWPAFTTITRYLFVADRLVKAELDHHLGGLLFDRIPGFNKLKWREVWGAKMWWGDLSHANYVANYANMADNPLNTGIVKVQTADKIPFVEMCAGIENIAGFFRIDAVWRVTHLDPTGTRFSFRKGNFGVRLAFEVQF